MALICACVIIDLPDDTDLMQADWCEEPMLREAIVDALPSMSLVLAVMGEAEARLMVRAHVKARDRMIQQMLRHRQIH